MSDHPQTKTHEHVELGFIRKYIFSTDLKFLGIPVLFSLLIFLTIGGLLTMLVWFQRSQIGAWEKIKYQSGMPVPDQLFEVSARQFEWRVRYPAASQLDVMVKSWNENKPKPAQSWSETAHADDIHVVNELHVWKGANVHIYLKTKDVIHSLYLPILRLKQDALPGKTIPVWFQVAEYNTIYDGASKRWIDGYDPKAEAFDHKEQIWDVVCAERCGWGHDKMIGRLYVHKDKEDFHKWLEYAGKKQGDFPLPRQS